MIMNFNKYCRSLLFILVFIAQYHFLYSQNGWELVKTENLSTSRHENAFVKTGGKFYLLGGRGLKEVEIYDPVTKVWSKGARVPIEISHFQAVAHHGLIYVMGGFTGDWPFETPISNILIYNPVSDKWIIGPKIPSHRQRGASGAAVFNGKIYLIGGIVNGHTSGWVAWFDEYDPATNLWKELPDAPRARDHFQTAITNNKLVIAGGRKSGYKGRGFEETVAETDIYNFGTNSWVTLPSPAGDIPTPRAGCAMVAVGNELIVIGGESGIQKKAHSEVEALNIESGTWRKLPGLKIGRHGTQALASNDHIYIVGGSGNRGGSPELNSLEKYFIDRISTSPDNSIRIGQLEVSRTNYTFTNVKPNEVKEAVFQLTNSEGNQAIPIVYLILTGSSEFELEFPHSLPYVLAPGSSVSFNVKFSPENNTEYQATLLIKKGISGNEAPIEITLKGN